MCRVTAAKLLLNHFLLPIDEMDEMLIAFVSSGLRLGCLDIRWSTDASLLQQ
jgi:hypothetical protein